MELTVVTSYGGDDGNRKNYENAVASYEAATGNKILDASGTSNEEWKAKVLSDCGVAVPGPDYTWDQFLSDCETIKAKGYTPIDGSWKVNYFVENYPDSLSDYAIAYVPAKGERKASEAIGGISMGYFITKKAWDDPAKQAAAVDFVKHMTSDEVMSTFVTTEVTALKNGASPSGLNPLQQAAADANANITGVVGAVQDTISSECKTDLFANVQNVVTGKMSAADAVNSAIAILIVVLGVLFSNIANRVFKSRDDI